MVYAHDSKSCGATHESSSLSSGTKNSEAGTHLSRANLQDRSYFLYLLYRGSQFVFVFTI